ncbi:MAG: zinc ABC transporter substrate-binding protein [Cytophagales bacterium]|nr:zinc ABC transporter substrate-binding protein [Cytophagales bacterium]
MSKTFLYLLLISGILLGCQPEQKPTDGRLNIVTTTGMLHDAVSNIVGDQIAVSSIMGPGVDPHLYKATQGDLSKLNQADLIIYNGLYLEGKMGEILVKLGRRKPVLAAGEKLADSELISTTEFGSSYDPHVWFDVSLWSKVIGIISEEIQRFDPENATLYQQNTKAYLTTLKALHDEVIKQINSIPKDQRVLITAHDAFGYFGRAYDIEVRGLQGLSTATDFGLRDIAEITDLIIERDIKAIFVETSVSDKAIKAVLSGAVEKGQEVVIGGYLFSDAMGEFGTEEGTYLGMVKKNVSVIVAGLK